MGSFRKWIRGEKSFFTHEQSETVLHKETSSSMPLNLKHLSKLFSGIPELITRTFPLKTEKKLLLYIWKDL